MGEPGAGAAKRIAFVLNRDFADWEAAFLSSGARDWFGCVTAYYTPGGLPVTSMAGLTAEADGAVEALRAEDYDALVVVGSSRWADEDPLDISTQLREADVAGKVVGAICAGTLAVARAGLLDERAHTSNGVGWIGRHVPSYRGEPNYRASPRAVRSGALVTAPGSAPGTFAIEVISALLPERAEEAAGMRNVFAREYDEN